MKGGQVAKLKMVMMEEEDGETRDDN